MRALQEDQHSVGTPTKYVNAASRTEMLMDSEVKRIHVCTASTTHMDHLDTQSQAERAISESLADPQPTQKEDMNKHAPRMILPNHPCLGSALSHSPDQSII